MYFILPFVTINVYVCSNDKLKWLSALLCSAKPKLSSKQNSYSEEAITPTDMNISPETPSNTITETTYSNNTSHLIRGHTETPAGVVILHELNSWLALREEIVSASTPQHKDKDYF